MSTAQSKRFKTLSTDDKWNFVHSWTLCLVQLQRVPSARTKGGLSLKVLLGEQVTCWVFAQGLDQQKSGFCFYKPRISFVQILSSICFTSHVSLPSFAKLTHRVSITDITVGGRAMETFLFFSCFISSIPQASPRAKSLPTSPTLAAWCSAWPCLHKLAVTTCHVLLQTHSGLPIWQLFPLGPGWDPFFHRQTDRRAHTHTHTMYEILCWDTLRCVQANLGGFSASRCILTTSTSSLT